MVFSARIVKFEQRQRLYRRLALAQLIRGIDIAASAVIIMAGHNSASTIIITIRVVINIVRTATGAIVLFGTAPHQ